MDYDLAISEITNWFADSNSKIKLIEEFPGRLGTISCIYDVALLEEAYCIFIIKRLTLDISNDPRILKIIVS